MKQSRRIALILDAVKQYGQDDGAFVIMEDVDRPANFVQLAYDGQSSGLVLEVTSRTFGTDDERCPTLTAEQLDALVALGFARAIDPNHKQVLFEFDPKDVAVLCEHAFHVLGSPDDFTLGIKTGWFPTNEEGFEDEDDTPSVPIDAQTQEWIETVQRLHPTIATGAADRTIQSTYIEARLALAQAVMEAFDRFCTQHRRILVPEEFNQSPFVSDEEQPDFESVEQAYSNWWHAVVGPNGESVLMNDPPLHHASLRAPLRRLLQAEAICKALVSLQSADRMSEVRDDWSSMRDARERWRNSLS